MKQEMMGNRQITMPVPHHSVFKGQMPFLPPNQQSQSTEGSINNRHHSQYLCTTHHNGKCKKHNNGSEKKLHQKVVTLLS